MSKTADNSFPFFSILTILFIALKLCHVINWSWWWVLAPILIPIYIAVIALGLLLIWKLL